MPPKKKKGKKGNEEADKQQNGPPKTVSAGIKPRGFKRPSQGMTIKKMGTAMPQGGAAGRREGFTGGKGRKKKGKAADRLDRVAAAGRQAASGKAEDTLRSQLKRVAEEDAEDNGGRPQ